MHFMYCKEFLRYTDHISIMYIGLYRIVVIFILYVQEDLPILDATSWTLTGEKTRFSSLLCRQAVGALPEGDLMPTLGFYKNRDLGWAKKIRIGKPPIFFHASRDSTLCLPYLISW